MANTRIIIYFFIIICTFIKCDSGVNPLYAKCHSVAANDKYDCFGGITQDEKDDGNHCCYSKYIGSSTGDISYGCDLLDQDEYNDIDGTKETLIMDYGLRDINIEC